MNTIEEIKIKLKALGIAESDTSGVMEDIMKLIVAVSLKSYVSKLTAEQKLKLESLSGSEIVKYLEDNKNDFPPMPEENFERIYQETWDNYFSVLGK